MRPWAGSMRMKVCRPAALPDALIDNGEIKRIVTRLHLLQPRLEGRPALGRFFAEVTKAIGCIRNHRDFEQSIAVTRRA